MRRGKKTSFLLRIARFSLFLLIFIQEARATCVPQILKFMSRTVTLKQPRMLWDGTQLKKKELYPEEAPQNHALNKAKITKKLEGIMRTTFTTLTQELELHVQEGRLENYYSWITQLEQSSTESLFHKIYEGISAALILKNPYVKVSFEPRSGFFNKENSVTAKSMDLKVLSNFEGTRTISYREVKTIADRLHVGSALSSASSKARAARRHSGDDVELGAIIFVTENQNDRNAFRVLRSNVERYLVNSEAWQNNELDFVMVIDPAVNRILYFRRNEDATFSVETTEI